jgi:hypothetical protein
MPAGSSDLVSRLALGLPRNVPPCDRGEEGDDTPMPVKMEKIGGVGSTSTTARRSGSTLAYTFSLAARTGI